MSTSPNSMTAPRLEKAVVNVGVRSSNQDPKAQEAMVRNVVRITGQQPVKTLAKKSISGFKIRKGMAVGLTVTLRGKRMEDFVRKLIHVALPRTRDFWGLSTSAIDGGGNLTIGFAEHIAFPEIRSDEVEYLHGLEVTLVPTRCLKRDQAQEFYTHLGFRFKQGE